MWKLYAPSSLAVGKHTNHAWYGHYYVLARRQENAMLEKTRDGLDGKIWVV